MKAFWVLLLAFVPLSAASTREASRQLLSHLALQGHERVLDLGCGDGSLSAEVAQQVPEGFVLGLDRSEAMIRFAEQTYDPELIANLQFQLGDASLLSYKEKFDVACLFSSLQWINDPSVVLKGVAKGLKTGGRLCLVIPLESTLNRVVSEVFQEKKWRKAAAEVERPTLQGAEWIVEEVRKAQLSPIHVETEASSVSFETAEELKAWLEDHLPETSCLAASQRGAFIGDVASRFIKGATELTIEQPTLSLVAVKR